jgi:filamentous hemagglutinin
MGPEGKYIEGKWGDAGSVRPDYYDDISNTVYEVKNYDMNKNLSGLKQNISQQIQNRKNIFGEGVEQIYILDIRGQSLIKTQQQIMNELVESTGLSPDSIKFIYKNI